MNKVNKSLTSAISAALLAAVCAVLQGAASIRVIASFGFEFSCLDTHLAAALAMIAVTVQPIVIQG